MPTACACAWPLQPGNEGNGNDNRKRQTPGKNLAQEDAENIEQEMRARVP